MHYFLHFFTLLDNCSSSTIYAEKYATVLKETVWKGILSISKTGELC